MEESITARGGRRVATYRLVSLLAYVCSLRCYAGHSVMGPLDGQYYCAIFHMAQ